MTEFSDQNIEHFLQRRFPDEKLVAAPKILAGGNINKVWRLQGKNGSYILKYAPPYIASAPGIPLASSRLTIEARALKWLESKSWFADTDSEAQVRAPEYYKLDENQPVLLMEDVAPHQEMEKEISRRKNWQNIGRKLGVFIGDLHCESTTEPALSERFNNQSIQQTRMEVQYQPVEQWLQDFDESQSENCGNKARELGEKYCSIGSCIIMGDLWPRSVLIHPDAKSIRLIDWEFAHYGRPEQDVAHLAAHCWMLAHRAENASTRKNIDDLWKSFCQNYGPKIIEEKKCWNEESYPNAQVHFGCELLIRSIGVFKFGYVYEGLAANNLFVKQTVDRAVNAILAKPEPTGNLGDWLYQSFRLYE